MEAESWRRNHGRGIMKDESGGGELMKKKSWRRNHGRRILEESWRRNHGGGIMKAELWRPGRGMVSWKRPH